MTIDELQEEIEREMPKGYGFKLDVNMDACCVCIVDHEGNEIIWSKQDTLYWGLKFVLNAFKDM